MQVEGFYLTAERGDRIALARLVNDLENLPNPQGDGGGASLLASRRSSSRCSPDLPLLSTSAPPPSGSRSPRSSACSARSWACSASPLALWLYQLHGRIQEQNESLKALARSVDQVASNQRLAMDTLLDKAGTDKPGRVPRAVRARGQGARRGPAAARRPAVDQRDARRPEQGAGARGTEARRRARDRAKNAGEIRGRRQGGPRAAQAGRRAGGEHDQLRRARREDGGRRHGRGQEGRGGAPQAQPLPDRDLHPRRTER